MTRLLLTFARLLLFAIGDSWSPSVPPPHGQHDLANAGVSGGHMKRSGSLHRANVRVGARANAPAAT